jgi:hypothetical protein
MKAPKPSSRSEGDGINWSQIAQQTVTDGFGRQFRWADIKGKTIFLCGHGTHWFKHGFCTVPPASSIDFYQVYGRLLDHAWVLKILQGGAVEIDRTISQGHSCLNLTLVEDDQKKIGESYTELRKSINWRNSYIFMANALEHLDTIPWEGEPRKCIQLQDIFRIAPGNHFKWVCCQQVTFLRADKKNPIVDPKEISPHLFAPIARKAVAKSSGLGKPIDNAVAAVNEISFLIKTNYNAEIMKQQYRNFSSRTAMHLEGSVFATVSAESPTDEAETFQRWQAGPAQRMAHVIHGNIRAERLNKLENSIEAGLCNLALLRLTTPESHKIRKILQDGLRKIADMQRKLPQSVPAGSRR